MKINDLLLLLRAVVNLDYVIITFHQCIVRISIHLTNLYHAMESRNYVPITTGKALYWKITYDQLSYLCFETKTR